RRHPHLVPEPAHQPVVPTEHGGPAGGEGGHDLTAQPGHALRQAGPPVIQVVHVDRRGAPAVGEHPGQHGLAGTAPSVHAHEDRSAPAAAQLPDPAVQDGGGRVQPRRARFPRSRRHACIQADPVVQVHAGGHRSRPGGAVRRRPGAAAAPARPPAATACPHPGRSRRAGPRRWPPVADRGRRRAKMSGTPRDATEAPGCLRVSATSRGVARVTTAAGRSRSVRPPRPTRAVLRQGLRIIWLGIRQEPRWFGAAVLGSVLWAAAIVGTSTAIGYVTETVITPAVAAREVTAGGLWTIFLVLLAVLVVNVTGVILRRVCATVAGFNLQARYRRRVTRQYLRLPLSWHHAHPSGQLLSNAHADIEATWQVFNPLPMAVGVIVMLVIAGTAMVLVDPVLALIGFLVFPALFAANLVFQRIMSPKITRAQQERAEVAEVAHESFEAGLVVKAMGREAEETARFRRVTHQLRDSLIEVGRTRGVFEPVIEAIPTLGTLAVLAAGTARVASGDISAADVVEIAYLFSLLAFPVRALGWVLAEIPRSVVGFRRVDSVLRATGSMEYGDRVLPREGAASSTARDIHYSYVDRVEREVLGEDVDPYEGVVGEVELTPAIRGVTLEV